MRERAQKTGGGLKRMGECVCVCGRGGYSSAIKGSMQLPLIKLLLTNKCMDKTNLLLKHVAYYDPSISSALPLNNN